MTTGGQNGGAPASKRPMPPSIPPRQRPAAPTPPQVQPTRQTVRPNQQQRPPQQRPAQQPTQRPAPKPAPASGIPKPPVKQRHWKRRCGIVTVTALALATFLFISAWLWVSHRIQHVDALSGAPNTAGETYLIVGSDSREGWRYDDGTIGARTDTILLLHKAPNGITSLISIPRDSYVEIPGHDPNKINAAFAEGGAQLLVQTVEQLSGLTIDAYMEVGLTGVPEVVDSLGGVTLCYDEDVDDKNSKLTWTAGCHLADGDTALAFARMRYADPQGDIGRAARQRQLVSAVVDGVFTKKVLLNPFKAMDVAGAGLQAFRVSDGTGPLDLARISLTFRAAQGEDAVTGTPPIKDPGYRVEGVGSTVLLDPDLSPAFWQDVAEGNFEPGSEVGGL